MTTSSSRRRQELFITLDQDRSGTLERADFERAAEAIRATRADAVWVIFTNVDMYADAKRLRRVLVHHPAELSSVATGVARLRATIQYRPVVFELMPSQFTLGQLQACVEALAGRVVHTQNFRRLVEQQQLVEETGGRAGTGGRPARLYRFRREVLQELPMEFAVEAQKLVGISLEGSVG